MRKNTNTSSHEAQRVIDAVRHHLQGKHPGGATLEVVPESVRQNQDWWYVSVRPDFQPPKRYEYYEALAEAELELIKQEKLTVLLLPTVPKHESSPEAVTP